MLQPSPWKVALSSASHNMSAVLWIFFWAQIERKPQKASEEFILYLQFPLAFSEISTATQKLIQICRKQYNKWRPACQRCHCQIWFISKCGCAWVQPQRASRPLARVHRIRRFHTSHSSSMQEAMHCILVAGRHVSRDGASCCRLLNCITLNSG